MEEENKVDVDTSTNEEELILDDSDTSTEEEKSDKEKKLEEIANNQKIRAEKAERELKELKSKPAPADNQSFSAKDTLALIESKVSSEDFDEVSRVAKVLGKPVSEALKDKTLQTILSVREEERRTANATQVKGGTRGASKIDGDDLLRRAETTGEVPESADDMQKLFMARMARKVRK